jgi:hypothetical protein
MLHFDDHSLLTTAHALFQLNPAVSDRFSEPADLVAFMRAMAQTELCDHAGYVGTYGFYLTTCRHPSGDGFYCIATLSSSLIVSACGL